VIDRRRLREGDIGLFKRISSIIGFWKSIANTLFKNTYGELIRYSKVWPTLSEHVKRSNAVAIIKKCRKNITTSIKSCSNSGWTPTTQSVLIF
jgi:hypothetical protein